MRRLNRKKTLSLVKELDAFPKVPDSYVETSASGGTGELTSDSDLLLTNMWALAMRMSSPLGLTVPLLLLILCQIALPLLSVFSVASGGLSVPLAEFIKCWCASSTICTSVLF